MKPCIGLVVPSLAQGGGVPSVARFVKDTALRSGCYRLKLVSLAMSADDLRNLGIRRPGSWWRGATTANGIWEGLPFVHVGAVAGELEFQRYRPRSVLAAAVADCDIVQVVCGSPAWANAVCGLGKPVAVQCATLVRIERRRRDAHPQGIIGWWRKAMTEITDRMDDHALRKVDAIQVENSWMLEYARRLNIGREVDLRYAPPGVDAVTFTPLPERPLDCHDLYILCVGRLDDPRKNIGLLLEAYALLPEVTRSRLRLVLAGQAGPPDSFWRRAETLGVRKQIEFRDFPSREKLVDLYQRASLFVLPSDEEGLGMVILEAMACGIPVVSTRSGGPDNIIADGTDGFLVPRDDAAAISDRMARLIADTALNRSLGSRARVTIEKRYTKEVAGEVFLDTWSRLIHKARKV